MKHEILEVNSKYDILHLEEEKNKSVILNLINEVAELQVATTEKKALILIMRVASERMDEKLLIENKDMFTDFEIVLPEVKDANNLYEELKFSKGYDKFGNQFECTSCGKTFVTKSRMEDHIKKCIKKTTLDRTKFVNFECASCGKTYVDKKKMDDHNRKCMQKKLFSQKVLEMKRQISEQTFQVTKSILDLKESKFEERISCRRECKPGCKIFHTKHNWCKSKSNN